MEKKRYWGIRSKIILCTVLCVVAVGLGSSLYLYQYMQRIISDKIAQIDRLNAGAIAARLDDSLEQVRTLQTYCGNSGQVIDALNQISGTPGAAADALKAQNAVNVYLRTFPLDSYINRLVIFSEDGAYVSATTTYEGGLRDLSNLLASEQFRSWKKEGQSGFQRLYPSLNPNRADCFALFYPVYGYASNQLGYVYIELSANVITDVLTPYDDLNPFFVQTAAGNCLTSSAATPLVESLPSGVGQDAEFQYDGTAYSLQCHPLHVQGLTLVSCVNQTQLQADNHEILFSTVTVIVMIMLIAVFILILLTHYITTPIRRITEKINRIAMNDYSFDPELEKPRSEMGEIGARLNELGLGFRQLLSETIALHDERARIEMDLLQSQVNPHFLYNTLNSVHWMAVVQKNTGIEKMVKSLVNLLKNISKGVSDRITLAEELALLDDYVSIQSIRYMGSFQYRCQVPEQLRQYKVIKFTLQPLVENAIFHGVVPKGSFGTITVDAFEEEDLLVLTIADDGMGMTNQEVAAALHPGKEADKSSMTGIGLGNVNQRLKLAYGKRAGLRVESVPGEYTKIYVRVSKET
ncbi:MAG: sensor histidine kinase [Oscillospiraceae bacterium]